MRKGRDISKMILKVAQKYEGDTKKFISELSLMLQRKNLTHLIPSILKSLDLAERKDQERNTLHISVAHSIDKKTTESIGEFMGALDAGVKITEDKDLIGGFRAIYGFSYIDGSVKSMLYRMRKILLSK